MSPVARWANAGIRDIRAMFIHNFVGLIQYSRNMETIVGFIDYLQGQERL